MLQYSMWEYMYPTLWGWKRQRLEAICAESIICVTHPRVEPGIGSSGQKF
jgi:hypothetical protein